MDLLVVGLRILVLIEKLLMMMMRNIIGILVQFPGWASCGGDNGNVEIVMMINDGGIRIRIDLHHHHHHLLHIGVALSKGLFDEIGWGLSFSWFGNDMVCFNLAFFPRGSRAIRPLVDSKKMEQYPWMNGLMIWCGVVRRLGEREREKRLLLHMQHLLGFNAYPWRKVDVADGPFDFIDWWMENLTFDHL